MIAGRGRGNTGNGRGFNEVLSLFQRRAGIVDTWRTETPSARLPDTSMTGTISTFSCVFHVFPFYPCALKQRFNRLPHFAKPVFFACVFISSRRRSAGMPIT
jgi:hypothetical protein